MGDRVLNTRRPLALAALAALAGSCFSATAASADAGLIVPSMRVEVYGENTATLRVCGIGESMNAGLVLWALTVEGVRVGGLPIAETRNSSAYSVTLCVDVPKITLAGSGTATFSFASPGVEAAGTFVGYFAWATGQRDVAGGSGIT